MKTPEYKCRGEGSRGRRRQLGGDVDAPIAVEGGKNHPDNWIDDLASPGLHAIAILFARNSLDRDQSVREHNALLARTPGVAVLSSMDLEAIPPFDHVREHFGYRDRLTTPEIEGSGIEPTPGSGPPIKAGEFILGYPDEDGPPVNLPQPEILSRNGSFMAYRRLQQHVGAFRDFLREQGGPTSDEQELLAAKLMGRWRSGAPLALAPEKDDPAIANDPRRNNNFSYGEMDPQGYAVPLGSDIRRMNPRDTAVNIQRRKVLRRGATYGPPLPEGSREDGVDRGIAVARAYLGEKSCSVWQDCATAEESTVPKNVWFNDWQRDCILLEDARRPMPMARFSCLPNPAGAVGGCFAG